MKETLKWLDGLAKDSDWHAAKLREQGRHIDATFLERRAKHLRRLIKMALYLFLPPTTKL